MRTVRSVAVLVAFVLHLTFVLGPYQRLVIFPAMWLRPSRRTHLLGLWIRRAARSVRAIVTIGGGVRISVTGPTIRESCVVVMNHQSVLDVMIALSEVEGPAVLIPVRTRYRWGIPTISPFIRAQRYPFIQQRRSAVRSDLAAIEGAAARVAAGEASVVIYPEGHRSRDGEIAPFMPRGLHAILSRAPRPVYCAVGDGMWKVRTTADALVGLAGTRVTVRTSGPFTPPTDVAELPRFIASLREHMIQELRALRAPAAPSTTPTLAD